VTWLRRFSLANPLVALFVAIGIGFSGVTIIIRPGMTALKARRVFAVRR
jgi:hypothetical protein